MTPSELVFISTLRWQAIFIAVLSFIYMGDPDLHDLILERLTVGE